MRDRLCWRDTDPAYRAVGTGDTKRHRLGQASVELTNRQMVKHNGQGISKSAKDGNVGESHTKAKKTMCCLPTSRGKL